MKFSMKVQSSASEPAYLGGIVSQDKSTVYWVNDTKPLP